MRQAALFGSFLPMVGSISPCLPATPITDARLANPGIKRVIPF
jgi:hypothetical protein